MKLTALLLITAILQVSASSYAQKITLSEKNTPLVQVFKQIRMQTGYDFVFSTKTLQDAKNVTINVNNVELKDVLAKIFDGQPLEFTLDAKTVVVSRKTPSFLDKVADYMANIDLHGRVLDENGNPLSGANVRIEAVPVSYVTGKDGNFYFRNVPENASMIVSYVGYKTDTIAIRGKTNFIITLGIQSNVIKEVTIISTGYQKLDKERATGAYAKPDMELFKNRTGTMDIVSRLDGLVPGLTVIAGPKGVTSSSRNGNSNTIQQSIIRGKSSINVNSDPLYVVNGLPVSDFSAINPDDVADITVLKDAAAAAIWGAKAANGVIVVNTKSGIRNSAVKISYSGFANFMGKPDFSNSKQLSSSQFIQVARETFNPTQFPYATLSTAYIAPHEQFLYDGPIPGRGLISATQMNKSLDSLSGINNADQIKDLFYRNAMTMNHTVSASGGTKAYSFYSSLSYTNAISNAPGEKNQTFRLNLGQDFNVGSRLKFALNTSLGNRISSAPLPVFVGPQFFPYQLFEDPHGNSLNLNYVQGFSAATRADYQARSRINLDYNPIAERDFGYSNSNSLMMNVTGDVTLKLFKGLSFQGTYGYQKAPGTNKSYVDIKSYGLRKELADFTVAPTTASIPVYYLPTTGGTYNVNNNDQRSWTLRNQLVYNTALRQGKDQLNLQVGQEGREQFAVGSSTLIRGYDVNLQTYPVIDYVKLSQGILNAVTTFRSSLTQQPFTNLEETYRYTSYFALANYSFDGKYNLDASWRVDHSNIIGADVSTQNKPTWSIGGKWNVKKEAFMDHVNWLDNLGMRATYGITGNSPSLGSSVLRDVLAVEGSFSGFIASGPGAFIVTPGNKSLSWEKTRTLNVGFDFAFLKSRLGGSIDLYRKMTTDLLGGVNLNPLTGFSGATGNIGKLRNKGIEIRLNSINIQTKDFSWNTSVNFSYNNNKLLSYSIVDPTRNTATFKVGSNYYVGYSMASLFAYKYAGLDNTGAPQIYKADGTITKNPTAAKAEDVIYMGTTVPVYNGGFTNNFRYKNITLTPNMIYSLGNVMRKDVNTRYNGRITGAQGSFSGNLTTYFLDRWKKAGDESTTDVPAYIAGESSFQSTRNLNYYTLADINVVSASYVKLRDVTLSYALSQKILNKVKIARASFYVQATNFMVWKANKVDIDPEYQDFNTGSRGNPPFNHSFSIGTNITF